MARDLNNSIRLTAAKAPPEEDWPKSNPNELATPNIPLKPPDFSSSTA